MTYETEIKFKVKDFTPIIKKLKGLGFQEQPWVLEQNHVFDSQEKTFQQNDSLLRLRKVNNKTILTFKGPAQKSDLKRREEIETEIENFENFYQILNKLGLFVHRLYEKKRKTFSKANLQVVLDTIPFIGNWLEIEGPESLINQTIEDLKLNKKDSTTQTYNALAEEYFNQGLDLTFEEEKNYEKT